MKDFMPKEQAERKKKNSPQEVKSYVRLLNAYYGGKEVKGAR